MGRHGVPLSWPVNGMMMGVMGVIGDINEEREGSGVNIKV